ncbi:hypothetical protein J1605_002333 [Eschrichtius robustus]|uniref:Uncharacterized protein n=1 Tax=Eschrichtius robustus TaxID=9764 RepID=A0AB34HV71_ESCRO|nr:hypothetical protein J1605_002333 [Eschrichtius robustus]
MTVWKGQREAGVGRGADRRPGSCRLHPGPGDGFAWWETARVAFGARFPACPEARWAVSLQPPSVLTLAGPWPGLRPEGRAQGPTLLPLRAPTHQPSLALRLELHESPCEQELPEGRGSPHGGPSAKPGQMAT